MRLEDGLEHDFVEALLFNLMSALGLATAVVELLAPPSRLVRLVVRRSCLRFRSSSATRLPSLLMDPRLALVSTSCVLLVAW